MAPYAENGSLTTGKRTINDADGWDSQTEWEAYQSASNVEINNGAVELLFSEIPASEADSKLEHRWVLQTIGDGVAEDSVGAADGTAFNLTSVSGDWAAGAAAESAGNGYVETTTLGSFVSNNVASGDAAFAFSIANLSTLGMVLGEEHDGESTLHLDMGSRFTSSTDELLNIAYREGPDLGSITNVESTTNFASGGPYRVVVNITGTTESDIQIWVNQSNDNATVARSDGDLSSMGDFQNPMGLFAWNNNGSYDNRIGAILDDICLFSSALTQTEIESYTNPWP